MTLSSKKCVPCRGGIPPMEFTQIKKLSAEIPTWHPVSELKVWKLKKSFKFEDFAKSMRFVNQVSEIAETEGHHPNILIHDWNKVELEIFTHKIRGLHENDFILASKIDQI